MRMLLACSHAGLSDCQSMIESLPGIASSTLCLPHRDHLAVRGALWLPWYATESQCILSSALLDDRLYRGFHVHVSN